jgi:hypothetical protein
MAINHAQTDLRGGNGCGFNQADPPKQLTSFHPAWQRCKQRTYEARPHDARRSPCWSSALNTAPLMLFWRTLSTASSATESPPLAASSYVRAHTNRSAQALIDCVERRLTVAESSVSAASFLSSSAGTTAGDSDRTAATGDGAADGEAARAPISRLCEMHREGKMTEAGKRNNHQQALSRSCDRCWRFNTLSLRGRLLSVLPLGLALRIHTHALGLCRSRAATTFLMLCSKNDELPMYFCPQSCLLCVMSSGNARTVSSAFQ